MAVEIIIPSPGESISEVTLGPWHKSSGEWVEKDDTLVEIESDKVTLEVPAPESGLLTIDANEGDEKNVGDVIGSIDPEADKPAGGEGDDEAKTRAKSKDEKKEQEDRAKKKEPAESTSSDAARNEVATATSAARDGGVKATSLARKIATERGVDLARIEGTGPSGRITKTDVLTARSRDITPAPTTVARKSADTSGGGEIARGDRPVRREKMSKLRQRIAERLVQAQHNAAMLTTFNEADMTEVMRLRKQHKEDFEKRHGVGLGFMSFFTKACVAALRNHPGVNAYIVGDEVEYHDYYDISIAVGTPKGLVVPVIRNAERKSFAEIEETVRDLATRAHDGKLTIDEMTGGTFTITNGGIYGSLNSTPILNPPQSGILGMHKIMNRAVEHPQKPGEIALRPMMYLALSYDHRIVDGEQAVKFLVDVKNAIENPERMLLGL